eukprot:scaffold2051_cov389-Prasinococcus_capsulatus_cf.AAC.8
MSLGRRASEGWVDSATERVSPLKRTLLLLAYVTIITVLETIAQSCANQFMLTRQWIWVLTGLAMPTPAGISNAARLYRLAGPLTSITPSRSVDRILGSGSLSLHDARTCLDGRRKWPVVCNNVSVSHHSRSHVLRQQNLLEGKGASARVWSDRGWRCGCLDVCGLSVVAVAFVILMIPISDDAEEIKLSWLRRSNTSREILPRSLVLAQPLRTRNVGCGTNETVEGSWRGVSQPPKRYERSHLNTSVASASEGTSL